MRLEEIRPAQYGMVSSSSSWEVRPEPSRRRDAEEQLGGDVVRARLQDPQGVVRTAEEARLQPREEFEVSTSKSWVRCTWQNRTSGRFSCLGVRRSLGVHSVNFQMQLWTCGMDGTWPRRLVDRRTLHAERPESVIGPPPSRRHSLWIKDEREARLQEIKHLNFCCAVYRWQTERGVHFLHEHPWRASSWDLDCLKTVRELPGVVVVRCDQRLYGLVERWPLKEGGWRERPSTQRTGWMTSVNDLARELSEVQGLDQSHELETRALTCLIAHATERYPPRLVEAILRYLSKHLRRKNGVPLDAVEVGIGPHVDDDVQDADFNETRLLSLKYYDQYTGLELDSVGAAAARQSEIDFAWRMKAFEPQPRTEAYQRMGRKPFGMRWIDCNKGDEQRPELRSRLVVQERRQTSTISVSDIAAVTSSTPPLEVVRLFCSVMTSMKGAGGGPVALQFLDVSRACPHAEVLRDDFYVETARDGASGRHMLASSARLVWDALNSLSVIISWIMTSNKGCSVHASSPIVANSCFTSCTGMITSGMQCVATWKVTKQNCLSGSSSRIEESWVPTACMRYEF